MCSAVNDAQDRQSFYQECWKATAPCQAPSIWKLAGQCQLCEQSSAGSRRFGLPIIQGYKIWLWFGLKCQNFPENKPLPLLQWNQSVVCCSRTAPMLFLYVTWREQKIFLNLIGCFKTRPDLYRTTKSKWGVSTFQSRFPIFLLKVVLTKLTRSHQCFYSGQTTYSSYVINSFVKAISAHYIPQLPCFIPNKNHRQ